MLISPGCWDSRPTLFILSQDSEFKWSFEPVLWQGSDQAIEGFEPRNLRYYRLCIPLQPGQTLGWQKKCNNNNAVRMFCECRRQCFSGNSVSLDDPDVVRPDGYIYLIMDS